MKNKKLKNLLFKYGLFGFISFIILWGLWGPIDLINPSDIEIAINNSSSPEDLTNIQNPAIFPKLSTLNSPVKYPYSSSALVTAKSKGDAPLDGSSVINYRIASTTADAYEMIFQIKGPTTINDVKSIRFKAEWFQEDNLFDGQEQFNYFHINIITPNGIYQTFDFLSGCSFLGMVSEYGDYGYKYSNDLTWNFGDSTSGIPINAIEISADGNSFCGSSITAKYIEVIQLVENHAPTLDSGALQFTTDLKVGNTVGVTGVSAIDVDSPYNPDHAVGLAYEWITLDGTFTTSTITISSKMAFHPYTITCKVYPKDYYGTINTIFKEVSSNAYSEPPEFGDLLFTFPNGLYNDKTAQISLTSFIAKNDRIFNHYAELWRLSSTNSLTLIDTITINSYSPAPYEIALNENTRGSNCHIYPNDRIFIKWKVIEVGGPTIASKDSAISTILNRVPVLDTPIHLTGGQGGISDIYLCGSNGIPLTADNLLQLFTDPDDLSYGIEEDDSIKLENIHVQWRMDHYTPRTYYAYEDRWIIQGNPYTWNYMDIDTNGAFSLSNGHFSVYDLIIAQVYVTDRHGDSAYGLRFIDFNFDGRFKGPYRVMPDNPSIAIDSIQMNAYNSTGDPIKDTSKIFADSLIGLTFKINEIGYRNLTYYQTRHYEYSYYPDYKDFNVKVEWQILMGTAWTTISSEIIYQSAMDYTSDVDFDDVWSENELDRQVYTSLQGNLADTFKKGDSIQVLLSLYDGTTLYTPVPIEKKFMTIGGILIQIADSPPVLTKAAFKTVPSYAGQGCSVEAQATDIDGDLIDYKYYWNIGGQLVSEISGSYITSALALTKPWRYTRGDTIEVIVKAYNLGADLNNPSQYSSLSTGIHIVGNAPPTIYSVSIPLPQNNTIFTGIPINVTAIIKDNDNDLSGIKKDDLDYRVYWIKNGKMLTITLNGNITPYESKSLDPKYFRRGDRIQAVIQPFDIPVDKTTSVTGNIYTSSEIFVGNSLPRIKKLNTVLTHQYMDDNISILVEGIDNDGDDISYQVKWYVNNKLLTNVPESQLYLLPTHFNAGDIVTFEIRAHDGLEGGNWESYIDIQIDLIGRNDAVDLYIFSRLTPSLWALFMGTILGAAILVQMQMKKVEKKSGKRQAIEATVIVTSIMSFYAILNTGVLIPLNAYKVDGLTLPQMIFMELVAVGFGIIISNFIQGFYSVGDTYKKGSEFLSDISARPSDRQSMQKAMFDAAKKPFQTQKISAIITNAANSDLVAMKSQLPSPKDLTAIVQSALIEHAVMGLYELSSTPPINNVFIKVVPAVEETETRYMETLSTYRKKMSLLFYSFVAIFAISVVIWKLRPDPLI